jgi:hypothetical protein
MVGLIALYAVLLQAFIVSTVPVAGAGSLGGIFCFQDAGSRGAPANDFHRHHGVCCILACAAFSFAAIAAAGGLAVFAAVPASRLVFSKAPAGNVRSPLKFYFAARGPPQSA